MSCYIVDGELYHYGIKGKSGRYPFGSGENPYQRLSPGARLSLRKTKVKAPSAGKLLRQKRKAAKIQAKEEKKRIKAEEATKKLEERTAKEKAAAQADLDAKKAKVLATRNPIEVYKHADLFSKEELDAIYVRFSAEKKLLTIQGADITKGKLAVDKALSVTKKANEVMSTGLSFYNNIVKVNKMINQITSHTNEPIEDKKKDKDKNKS